MAIGTAGFTAALSVARSRSAASPGDGPVLVTGAAAGSARPRVAILVGRGYEAWAATGKPTRRTPLLALGAAGILPREEVTAESPRPLESERWAGAVDASAARRCLHPAHAPLGRRGRRQRQHGRRPVRDDGLPVHPARRLAARDRLGPGADRGRRRLWDRIAGDLRPRDLGSALTEVDLDGLEAALDGILGGTARGRWIVRIAG